MRKPTTYCSLANSHRITSSNDSTAGGRRGLARPTASHLRNFLFQCKLEEKDEAAEIRYSGAVTVGVLTLRQGLAPCVRRFQQGRVINTVFAFSLTLFLYFQQLCTHTHTVVSGCEAEIVCRFNCWTERTERFFIHQIIG